MGDIVISEGQNLGLVKINGRMVHLPENKKYHLPQRGYLIKVGTKLTMSTGNDEEADFYSYAGTQDPKGQPFYFNSYVRSSARRITGACSNQYIPAKGLFSRERKARIKKVKKPRCPKRRHYERYCHNRGAIRAEFKTCVFDLCAGISRKNEKRIIKITRKEERKVAPKKKKKNKKKRKKSYTKKKKKIVIPVRRRVTCAAEGDPHFTLFDGRHLDFQGVGDWVLYKGHHLTIHYRGASWYGFPRVQIKFAAKIRGDIIISQGQDLSRIKVNNRLVHLPENKVFKLPNGGSLTKSGNRLNMNTNINEDADFYSYAGTTDPRGQPFYFNSYVRSASHKIGGACAAQYIQAKGLFSTERKARIKKVKLPKCPKRKRYIRFCEKRTTKKSTVKNCVFDLCAGIRKNNEKKLLKYIK